MSDIVVRVGNSAPTTSVRRQVTEAESVEAGPLGQRDTLADGTDVFYVLDQESTGADEAITTFVIPHAYSIVDAVKDIGLAFTRQHSQAPASWVHSDHEIARSLVANHLGKLGGVEVPEYDDKAVEAAFANADLEKSVKDDDEPVAAGSAIQAIGRDLWAQALGDMVGTSGTATATSATTLTNSGASWGTTQYVGKDVFAGTVAVGTILSHTGTALTIARWETPGARSGAAASTPGSTSTYFIASGQAPAAWMALTANSSSPSTGGSDTTLTGEIATAGGGLVRAVAVYAHTTGTNTYTLTITFTANGSDSLPVTVAKIGVFQSQNGGRLLYETLLSSTATLNTSGDNIQCTDTVTGT